MVNFYCIRPRVWKSCGRDVQNLLRTGQQKLFSDALRAICAAGPGRRSLRVSLRLIAWCGRIESSALATPTSIAAVTIHHFEQTIGGRPYQIEVTRVSNRWRAQLRRGPGMPTAMMP